MIQSKSGKAGASILVLDDEEIIRHALRETLRIEHHEVTLASSADEALAILKEREFAVIISDQRMPEKTGLEFFEESKKLQPDASRILITGVLTLKTVIDSINRGEIFRFIPKPWIREELLATVSNAVQRYRLIQINKRLRDNTILLNERLSNANAELHSKIDELSEKTELLNRANTALEKNFSHSLDLCSRIITTYHPSLGKEIQTATALCERMSEAAGLAPEHHRVLVTSARLHNIGLIGISRDIILRYRRDPSGISETERNQIRNHPIYGQSLASFVADLKEVGEVIRHVHEHWDGSGYPDGLAGELIPPLARLLAVAVGYAASPLPQEKAADAILQESGRKYEPEAVRVFLAARGKYALPRKVREIRFSELQPGMVLAEGIFSPAGMPLVQEDTLINDGILRKLKEHNLADPFTQRFLVFN